MLSGLTKGRAMFCRSLGVGTSAASSLCDVVKDWVDLRLCHQEAARTGKPLRLNFDLTNVCKLIRGCVAELQRALNRLRQDPRLTKNQLLSQHHDLSLRIGYPSLPIEYGYARTVEQLVRSS
jgi:hypothetical protein